MIEHQIKTLTGISIAKTGRETILHFDDKAGQKIELHLDLLQLQKLSQDVAQALMSPVVQGRLSSESVVPFRRPPSYRAELTKDSQTVVISFRFDSGLEVHYGILPKGAEGLGQQLLDAAQRHKTAIPLKPN